jgi:hypothetical protein
MFINRIVEKQFQRTFQKCFLIDLHRATRQNQYHDLRGKKRGVSRVLQNNGFSDKTMVFNGKGRNIRKNGHAGHAIFFLKTCWLQRVTSIYLSRSSRKTKTKTRWLRATRDLHKWVTQKLAFKNYEIDN